MLGALLAMGERHDLGAIWQTGASAEMATHPTRRAHDHNRWRAFSAGSWKVEDSERRYSEALDELQPRSTGLSETTGAARRRSPEESSAFARLHSQVSNLARPFGTTPHRARRFRAPWQGPVGGWITAVGVGRSVRATDPFGSPPHGSVPWSRRCERAPFSFSMPDSVYSAPPSLPPLPDEDHDRDQRCRDGATAGAFDRRVRLRPPPSGLECATG